MQLVQILGSGQMGQGIARTCLDHGYRVHLVDQDQDTCARAARILREKCTLGEEATDRLSFGVTLLEDETFCVIEAIIENLEAKTALFASLPSFSGVPPIIASNTSSYSITTLGQHTKHPERFIGLHFMNPAHHVPLVEVIRGNETSEDVYTRAVQFVESLGKTAVAVKDTAGFVVNRILIPMIHDAIKILEEGGVRAQDIDAAMTLGARHPLGPLALADIIGLDTCQAILIDLQKRLHAPHYHPCTLLQNMVRQNHLGKKSGKGFYDYTADTAT